jgi:hypothetical protein
VLILLDYQRIVLRADFNLFAGFEFTFEQLSRERVERMFLNRASQGAREGKAKQQLVSRAGSVRLSP